MIRAGEGRKRALQQLCEAYWYPLYAYVRRRGHSPEDAADLTQGFFAMLLERNDFAKVRREKGRFRSYLLSAMRNYISNQRERKQAKKRGGDAQVFSLDLRDAEGRFRFEPSTDEDAEKLYQRQWTLTLLDRVLTSMRDEYASTGRGDWFDLLKPSLQGATPAYADLAKATGSTPGAIKVAVHRLRAKYKERLREEVAQTVGHADAIEDELRELLSAVS